MDYFVLDGCCTEGYKWDGIGLDGMEIYVCLEHIQW